MAKKVYNDSNKPDTAIITSREAVIRFSDVSYGYGHNHPILDEVNFVVRKGMKMTVMGQNGAGKSTLFKLMMGTAQPDEGEIQRSHGATIALAHQVVKPEERELTVREFFQSRFDKKIYDIDPRIDEVLEIVNVHAPHDRIMKSFSGGQQARLLLASALILDPDILLLDEPTNNLDAVGISHLTDFLKKYEKTVLVISHDAEFLNAFTQGVLYLDVHSKKMEQYVGNYFDVLEDIKVRIEKEERKNAQFAKKIQENKDKINFFAHKGGKMRLIAKKLRDEVGEMEEDKVDVRREDKTIRAFTIPNQPDVPNEIMTIHAYTTMDPKTHKPVHHKASVMLKKRTHLLLKGPNGIGKTTLLETLASGHAEGAQIKEGVSVGYYRQDFSTLNFEHTVYESLLSVMKHHDEQKLRSVAAGFLIDSDTLRKKVGTISEGQKGLVAFARLCLQAPGLLILDEPTNHINFRHIPVIAKALSEYEGAMIVVSHVPEFVAQIRIDEVLDLEKGR